MCLPVTDTDLGNSVNWTGKLVGCAIFEPLAERLGFKKTFYILAAIQIVAVIREYIHSMSFPLGLNNSLSSNV